MYIRACDATGSAQGSDKGVNGGVVSSPFVVSEALEKRRRLVDWAHDDVVSVEQRDHLYAVAVLLKVGVMQGAVIMCDKGVVEKELDISNTDDFGAAVLSLGQFGVLA